MGTLVLADIDLAVAYAACAARHAAAVQAYTEAREKVRAAGAKTGD